MNALLHHVFRTNNQCFNGIVQYRNKSSLFVVKEKEQQQQQTNGLQGMELFGGFYGYLCTFRFVFTFGSCKE